MNATEETRVEELFDILAGSDGYTISELIDIMGTSRGMVYLYIRQTNAILNEDRTASIIAVRPENGRGPWTYRLTEQYDDNDTKTYCGYRLGDTATRIESLRNVTAPLVAGSMRARIMHRQMERMLEDLSDMEEMMNEV